MTTTTIKTKQKRYKIECNIYIQCRRAKFQNKLNQVQLYSLINIIELSLGSSDIIISEKVAEYNHPIECCPKQLQLLVIQ